MYDPIAALLALPKAPPMLKPGSTGWAVRLLCRLLAVQGVAQKDWLAEGVAVPGTYSPIVKALVRSFQLLAGIEPDGICGPETWAWLGCRRFKDLGEITMVYARAEAYLGAREIGGNNRGPWVKKYVGWTGEAAQWCAGYATWCLAQACERLGLGALIKWTNKNSSSMIARDADEHRRLIHPSRAFSFTAAGKRVHALMAPPHRGDLALRLGGATGCQHTTLLDRIEGETAYVWEGNVRPRKWLPWQLDAARPGSYPLKQMVFVDLVPRRA